MRNRANRYLKAIAANNPPSETVNLPVAAVRIGSSLTFTAMGGEVVVDYSRKLKRLLAEDHPWMIGYAYEVPCYIPSARILNEGGYEAEASLMLYGLYGPFQSTVEDILVRTVTNTVAQTRGSAAQ